MISEKCYRYLQLLTYLLTYDLFIDTIGAVTFLAPDGWIRAPSWNSPYGGDISFYIKTVATKGDLVDHRSSDETYVFQVPQFE